MASSIGTACCVCAHVINYNVSNSFACAACGMMYHYRCYQTISPLPLKPLEHYLCSDCNMKLFPFNNIVDDVEFLSCVTDKCLQRIRVDDLENNQKLAIFDDNSESRYLLNNPDIDPDLNYFNNASHNSSYVAMDDLISKFFGNEYFSTLHVNCRSVLSKVSELQDMLIQLPVSVLALTETWLENCSEDTFSIPGYQITHRPRVGSKGGDVALLMNDKLSFKPFDHSKLNISISTLECLFIRVQKKTDAGILIGVIYRPPGTPMDMFNDEMDSLLSQLLRYDKEIILLGDFNVDLLKTDSHRLTNVFYNCMSSHHLLPVITRPTRITNHSSTLIDNIFTSTWSKIIRLLYNCL